MATRGGSGCEGVVGKEFDMHPTPGIPAGLSATKLYYSRQPITSAFVKLASK